MDFLDSGFTSAWHFRPPQGLLGYGLLAAYVFILVGALALTRRDWLSLRPRGWLGVLLLSVAGGALSQLLLLRFSLDLPPPPNLPIEPTDPSLPLLALAPAFLAAGTLGSGPALIVGFITGLGRAAWETYSILTPFEYAFVAGLFGWCVRQEYRGGTAALMRMPLVAGILAGGLLWPLLYLSYAAYTEDLGLAAVDYVLALASAAAPVFVAQSVIAGVVAEAWRLLRPSGWIRPTGTRPPPWLYSLNRKFLFALVPLFVLGLIGLFIANISIVMGVSTRLTLGQMERALQNAGQVIPLFISSGKALLAEIASSQDWFRQDPVEQAANLLRGARAVAFFKQLTLLDSELKVTATAGVTLSGSPPLTPEQLAMARRVLEGVSQGPTTIFLTDESGNLQVETLFFQTVLDPGSGKPVGVLVGWAELESNLLLQSVFSNLAGVPEGIGFIVGEDGLILYHPNPVLVGQPFALESSGERLETSLAGATALRDRGPDGNLRLLLYYPLTVHPWTLVATVPHAVVLRQAQEIVMPIIYFLLGAGVIGISLVSLIAIQLARPAEQLAQAAKRISENRLDEPVQINSEDEIGRAGKAFEHMRQKLRDRLSELDLLLNVSKGVSSSLDLHVALPSILRGALAATRASGVRLVLVPGSVPSGAAPSSTYLAFADGPQAEVMAVLDRGIVELTHSEARAAIIENLARAKAVLDVTPVLGKLSALIALPLRQEQRFYGALWLAYDSPHTFSDSELNFLTTLAGQASVAIANMSLFGAAEQERRRLSAILACTPDGIIVTDPQHRILLMNPAAEAEFELTGKPLVGRLAAEVLPSRELAQFIQGTRATNTGEFTTANGRTLYASLSPITDADGQSIGRVCILRDVTHFKQLDLMKSDFVATVSHDLRAPLTFMRGYTTMMPMVGPLNDKQKEFNEKILAGIEQMTKLIDDLLDLGRIEAGVGLAKEPCRLDDIVRNVVDSLTPVATNKGLSLHVDVPRDLPLVSGDPTLLRQAVANLVDNAIKYTPSGGQVSVRVFTENGKFAVAVSDTGVGIAPADQAHLFEKFFRVRQRGSTTVKGSGLGLAIVKSIVERHGGRVWMESKLGKGSTFYLEIPRDGGPLPPAPNS
ncbi:MAG: ATP-binding protein, partial [Anaerolineales bacterium]|nr:ATP-binding protein [Anaerolineales bacterium]